MSAPRDCLTWDEAPATIKVEIMRILGPRVPILDHVPDVPKTHGYIYLIFFLPLWRRGEKRFAYIGKKSAKADLRYRGKGRRSEFQQALEEVPPGHCVKVFLGVYPRGRNLSRMEFMLQRRVGIPDAGSTDDIDHDVWFNRFAWGGSKWQHQTFEQHSALGKKNGPKTMRLLAERERTDPEFRAKMQAVRSASGRRNVASGQLASVASIGGRAGGKIAGKIAGKKSGPAAARGMNQKQKILEASNDPGHWERLAATTGLPLIYPPSGWRRLFNSAGSGFYPKLDMIIVPVAVRRPHWSSRSGAKDNLWREPLYLRGASTFAQCVEDRARLYPGDRHYGSRGGARSALSRDSARGLFCICCPETGRILRGPGMDQETLRWTGGGWRRGRVISRGPYGWLHTTP